VRPLCVEAGLLIVPDEERCEIVGEWLVLKFSFMLSLKDGETWDHRPTRTVMVTSKMGAQAFGAAQSYALKQFMRGIFQIATGDGEDGDTHEHGDLSQARRQGGNGHQNANGKPPERPRKENYTNSASQQQSTDPNGTAPQGPPVKSIKQAKAEIDEAAGQSREMMKAWKEANADWLAKLEAASPDKYRELMNHFDQMWTFAA